MGEAKKSKSNSAIKSLKTSGLRTKNLKDVIKTHDLLIEAPEMCLPYSVYQNSKGKLIYTNQNLCAELGINTSSKNFEQEVLSQFNLRILNEYDRLNHTKVNAKSVKPYQCFATRYLQLQHENKRGKTSGDGRAVWNGTVSHKNKKWDISSRGTGVTSLAPGVVEAKKPLATGNTEFGYSCGLSELHEIYTTILMSERFYKMGYKTERTLFGIDLGNGLGISIRASQNLIRPAHLFRYLKLDDHYGAKSLFEYTLDREFQNKKIDFNSKSKNYCQKYLKVFANNFAELAAKSYFDDVFLWLDWDGDNILIDGGIIDYGSIRHFGAHHNKYRYDDVTRFSTNLDEQIQKAKLTVQVFCQLTDFIATGKKKSIASFLKHPVVKNFEEDVEKHKLKFFLKHIGLSDVEVKKELSWKKARALNLYKSYLKIKKLKCSNEVKSSDGINTWPMYNANFLLKDSLTNGELDYKIYKTTFSEHKNSKKVSATELKNFVSEVRKYREESGYKLAYKGDASTRLTTSALLHLVEVIEKSSSPRALEKALNDSISYGFEKNSEWVTKIKNLYRDSL